MLTARRPFRQHEIAELCRRIPDVNLDIVCERHSEFPQYPARIDDRTRAIGRGFVPDGRQTQQWPWIAGAQSADDKVVHARGILHYQRILALRAAVAEFSERSAAIRQQAC